MLRLLISLVSIPFRADTGFEHLLLILICNKVFKVSIPFRADTGFEHKGMRSRKEMAQKFQSLSGLTLGLNFGEQSR